MNRYYELVKGIEPEGAIVTEATGDTIDPNAKVIGPE